jgi:hypothetical protein
METAAQEGGYSITSKEFTLKIAPQPRRGALDVQRDDFVHFADEFKTNYICKSDKRDLMRMNV